MAKTAWLLLAHVYLMSSRLKVSEDANVVEHT